MSLNLFRAGNYLHDCILKAMSTYSWTLYPAKYLREHKTRSSGFLLPSGKPCYESTAFKVNGPGGVDLLCKSKQVILISDGDAYSQHNRGFKQETPQDIIDEVNNEC